MTENITMRKLLETMVAPTVLGCTADVGKNGNRDELMCEECEYLCCDDDCIEHQVHQNGVFIMNIMW